MLGFLLLIGAAVGVSAIMVFEDDAPRDEDFEPMSEGSDGDDLVSDSAHEDDFIADVEDLISNGEITEAEAQRFLNQIDYRDGAINIDTKAGDDTVYGSEQDDTIVAGEGDDLVLGGQGDDLIELGDGDDVSGIDGHWRQGLFDDTYAFPLDYAPVGGEAQQERGDDSIFGGDGDDSIADGYGRNTLDGGDGDDFLIAVDEDGLTPDTVIGGAGKDEIVVDEGDTVTTGSWADYVVIELHDPISDDYQPIEVTDFSMGKDELELTLWDGAGDPDIAIADNADSTAAILSVDGVEIATIVGGQGLTLGDLTVV